MNMSYSKCISVAFCLGAIVLHACLDDRKSTKSATPASDAGSRLNLIQIPGAPDFSGFDPNIVKVTLSNNAQTGLLQASVRRTDVRPLGAYGYTKYEVYEELLKN